MFHKYYFLIALSMTPIYQVQDMTAICCILAHIIHIYQYNPFIVILYSICD